MSDEPRVVITDHPWATVDVERRVLASVPARVEDGHEKSDEGLLEMVRAADAIITCFRTVSREMIDDAPRLKVVARSGIGVDNIDVAAATARGIPVTNVPSYCAAEIAEHVIALIYSLRRRTVDYDRGVRTGDWTLTRGGPLHRLAGQTVGVIGYGSLGAAVARHARALGFSVLAFSRSAEPGAHSASGVEFVTLADLLQRAHVVTLHVPLTPETTQLVDAGFLAAMRPDAVLINAARGGLIDQEALAEALEDATIAGAGLDVFDPEQLPAGHRLLRAPHTVLTPHVAYYSEESLAELAHLTAGSVADVLAGRRPRSIVNESDLGRRVPGWWPISRAGP